MRLVLVLVGVLVLASAAPVASANPPLPGVKRTVENAGVCGSDTPNCTVIIDQLVELILCPFPQAPTCRG